MVFLVVEVRAEAAVLATAQIRRKQTVLAVLAETQELAVVRAVYAETLVAELAVVEVVAVDRVLAFLHELSVVTVLAVFRRIDQVTVFAVARARRVFAVLISDLDEPHARDCFVEFRPLLKKRLRKIKRTSVFHRIPLIPVPFILCEDFVGFALERLSVVEGNYFLSREGGRVLMQEAFVPVACAFL